MKVRNELTAYEVNGAEFSFSAKPGPVLAVESHLNRKNMVQIAVEVPNGTTATVTVVGHQLIEAVKNAMNCPR